MNKILQELVFTSIPVVLLVTGGILAIYKTVTASFKSMTLHFAAGVVFSVVAVELLPDMVKIHDPFTIVVGFSLGIASMLVVKRFTINLESTPTKLMKGQSLPWAALTGVGIDLLIDGILLGIGFAAGKKEGMLLAIALSLECFSLGIAVVISSRPTLNKQSRVYQILLVLGLIFIIGAVTGLLLLHNASDTIMETILSFGAAALLYLVTEELLVEAHEEKDSPLFTALFFAGFLIFLILGIII